MLLILFFFTVAQMIFCFSEFSNGQCVGQFLGAPGTVEGCCLPATQGGLQLRAPDGGYVLAGTQGCIRCAGKSSNPLSLNVSF